jgi:4,5-DOPA dioxygenase extradiol
MNNKMPMLFVGHGSPMNAIEDNTFTKNFRKVASQIPKPKSILCVSAHWVTNGTKVTMMEDPKTIHDFYGFPEELYQIEYKTKGSIELAKEVKKLLSPIEVHLDKEWGLDHGTWTVLRHMYPNADIPVVQLSLDYSLSTQEHFDIAQKLSSLREEGILIIGSGNMIHNLGMVDFEKVSSEYGYDWAQRVQKILNESILSGDYTKLLNYEKEGVYFHNAIPTPEHFWPLIYILGLKEKTDKVEIWNDTLVGGSLSMTAVKVY